MPITDYGGDRWHWRGRGSGVGCGASRSVCTVIRPRRSRRLSVLECDRERLRPDPGIHDRGAAGESDDTAVELVTWLSKVQRRGLRTLNGPAKRGAGAIVR